MISILSRVFHVIKLKLCCSIFTDVSLKCDDVLLFYLDGKSGFILRCSLVLRHARIFSCRRNENYPSQTIREVILSPQA